MDNYKDKDYTSDVPITISGNGVASVKSSDLLKSAKVQRQIKALRNIKLERTNENVPIHTKED